MVARPDRGHEPVSYATIHGLRFRRVTIARDGYARTKMSGVCDALICTRCTAVLADSSQAARHVCMPRYWQAGLTFDEIETVPMPHAARQRVAISNASRHADLWPHGVRLLKPRETASLHERYETLSVLLAELAAMESAASARRAKSRTRAHE